MKTFTHYAAVSILLIVLIITAGVIRTSVPAHASTDLPQSDSLIVGQTQNTFFAAQPTANDASQLYVSVDGRNWRILPEPVPGRLTSIAISPLDDGLIYAATEEGLFVTDDGGRHWNERSAPARVTALALDTQMADLVYVATDEPALYRVTDFGNSWQQVAAEGLDAQHVTQLAVSPVDNDVVFAATNRGLFRSTTVGETWARVNGLPGSVTTLAFSPHTPAVLYAGTQDTGLYRSRDGGETWEAANTGLDAAPGASLAITALAVDPVTPGTLYAATGYVLGHTRRVTSPGGLYVSADGANTWARVTRFEAGAPAVTAVLPAENSTMQAVTDEGVKSYSLDVRQAIGDLESSDVATRRAAARMLTVATVGGTHADALSAHLDDPDPEVGYFVAHALGRSGDERIVATLVARVADGEPSVQRRAILALGELGSPDAVPILADTFRTNGELAGESARALARIGTDDALSPLIAALRQEEHTPQRQAAMAALEAAGDRAVLALVAALDEEDTTLRATAIETLGWIAAPEAIRSIRTQLDDPAPRVRRVAVWALGELGDTYSLQRLQTMAGTDESVQVRAAAEEALVRIERQPAQAPVAPEQDRRLHLSLPFTVSPEVLAWAVLALATVGVLAFFVIREHGRKLAR